MGVGEGQEGFPEEVFNRGEGSNRHLTNTGVQRLQMRAKTANSESPRNVAGQKEQIDEGVGGGGV